MFVEKIDDELIEEIQEEMDAEIRNAYSTWDDEIIDLNEEDIEDLVRSHILSDYHNIPFYKLHELIYLEYPFIKEKDIIIDPYSEITHNKIEDDESDLIYTELFIDVTANIHHDEWKKLDKPEKKIVKRLLKELTSFYHNRLNPVKVVFLYPLTEEELLDFEDDPNLPEYNLVKISLDY